MKCKRLAAAKLNLLLDLTGTFSDGYHGIYTIMQSVGIYDTVVLEKTTQGVSMTCDAAGIPADERNTAWKAAVCFFHETGMDGGVNMQLQKQIPSGAGMAGGSADAAAVLDGLNELYGSPMTKTELMRLAAKIGADVPFCLLGGTALCQNIGELCTPLPRLSDLFFVCVQPKSPVSTAQAYAAYDRLQNVRHPAKEVALNAYLRGDLTEFFRQSANVFEQAVDVPGRAEIKSVMRAFRCDFTQMTGSGSVVFGVFHDEKTAEDCAAAIRRGGRKAMVTIPVDKGIM